MSLDAYLAAERWLPIPGYEGRYEVSDQGRVRSFNHYHHRLHVMAFEKDRYGYRIVRLNFPGGAREKHKVHLLVMSAFVGPRPQGGVTRHLNGDPADNRIENLRYGTQSENIADQVRHGNHHWSSRTHCANGHEYSPENTHYKPSKSGRICLVCYRANGRNRMRRRRARLREAA